MTDYKSNPFLFQPCTWTNTHFHWTFFQPILLYFFFVHWKFEFPRFYCVLAFVNIHTWGKKHLGVSQNLIVDDRSLCRTYLFRIRGSFFHIVLKFIVIKSQDFQIRWTMMMCLYAQSRFVISLVIANIKWKKILMLCDILLLLQPRYLPPKQEGYQYPVPQVRLELPSTYLPPPPTTPRPIASSYLPPVTRPTTPAVSIRF